MKLEEALRISALSDSKLCDSITAIIEDHPKLQTVATFTIERLIELLAECGALRLTEEQLTAAKAKISDPFRRRVYATFISLREAGMLRHVGWSPAGASMTAGDGR
jgi:hypothetical protein